MYRSIQSTKYLLHLAEKKISDFHESKERYAYLYVEI